MNTIGLILARGGSQEVPDKNLRSLDGKPLLAWTIEATIQSGLCNKKVWVASESEKIRGMAREGGAATFELPVDLVAGHIYSAEVALHVINNLYAFRAKPETMIFLQATSPFRTARHIQEAYALYRGFGTVIGVSKRKKYYWRSDLNDEGMIPAHTPHAPRNRKVRQLTDSHDWFYEENGSVYVVNVKRFLEEKIYILPPFIPYVMPEEASLQIDTPYDFWLAEKWLEYKRGE